MVRMSGRRALPTLLALALASLPAVLAAQAEPESASVFLLKRASSGFEIERVAIAPGGMKVFDTGDGVIDLIFPPGPGQSAALVEHGDKRLLIVRHGGHELRVKVRSADGSERELPPRTIDDLRRYDIRVNVTGGGDRAAFLIECNETAHRDVGPVANLFAGRVPPAVLESGWVVQTDTYLHDAGEPVVGSVDLRVAHWPFVQVTLPDGTSTDFIVDIGAGTSLVARSVLPEEVEIEKASMVEYSAAGKRTLKYAPGGATGAVETIVGLASLEHLRLGGLEVPDVTADVIDELPDFIPRSVGGILGMDVLRRTHRLVLSLDKTAALKFGAAAQRGGSAIELPFAFVSTHLVVEGAANGTPVFFILDTGAPSTHLDASAARAAHVRGDEAKADKTRGLDEGSATVMPGTIGRLTLGGWTVEEVPCRISELVPFDQLRSEDQHVGLLGNDFLSRFDRIEIDFSARKVRFVR